MKLQFILPATALLLMGTVVKAEASSDKDALITNMLRSCQVEMNIDPVLVDTSDAEKVWQNLNSREKVNIKFSKACLEAQKEYQAKFHQFEDREIRHER